MNWKIKLSSAAEKDLRFWHRNSKRTFEKIRRMIGEISEDPYNINVIGKPKFLSGDLSGCISRRINKGDRPVYQVLEQERTVKILQMRYHY